jgi:hypothetical protein
VARPELEFSTLEDVPWRAVGGVPGTFEKILSRDDDTGDYTRLLRFEPGADTSAVGVFRHDHWEEVFIISGSIHDVTLDQTFGSGRYACRPPGMPHGPWTSSEGCLLFEVRYHK